jgi:membrane fusion protein (multidrug efflux system)
MKKLVIFLGTLLGIAVLAVVLFKIKKDQFVTMGQAHASKPSEVTASAAVADHWEPTINTVGSLAPYQGVTVTTESSGIVSHIDFEAGTKVQAGALLVKLDTSVLEAQLQAAEARAELARVSAERIRELYARNSSAKAEQDSSDAQYKQALAEVASTKALISQKQVRAPFTGRLGIRQINIGQYIDRGNPIVSLQSLDPIYVNFTLPQQQLSQIATGMKVRVTVDALPGKIFEGAISAINPDVDSATRNVRVQATLANAEEQLRPGMFTSVSVVLPNIEDVIIVPITSILYAPYGDSVFIVDEKVDEKTHEKGLVLRQQFVRLGKTRGDFIAIVSGLKAGQRVVTSGVFKLRNGMAVIIDNTLAPEVSLAPKPGNS